MENKDQENGYVNPYKDGGSYEPPVNERNSADAQSYVNTQSNMNNQNINQNGYNQNTQGNMNSQNTYSQNTYSQNTYNQNSYNPNNATGYNNAYNNAYNNQTTYINGRPYTNGQPYNQPYNQAYNQQYGQQYGGVGYTYNQPVRNESVSATAVVSLVFGILSIVSCCCYGIISVIFGVVAIICALVSKKDSNGKLSGLAMGGLICGIIGLVLGFVFFVLMIIGILSETSTYSDYYYY